LDEKRIEQEHFIIPLTNIFPGESEWEIDDIVQNLPQDIITLLKTDTVLPIEKTDEERFAIAVSKNCYEEVIKFEDISESEIFVALAKSMQAGFKEIFEFLFKKILQNWDNISPPEIDQLFINSASKSDAWFLKFIAANVREHTALSFEHAFHNAMSYNSLQNISILLDLAPEFEKQGNIQMLFQRAVDIDRINVIKFFLKKGADIHFANDAPFISAIKHGSDEFLHFFFERGETVPKDVMQTGLVEASLKEEYDIVELLLKNGADVADQEVFEAALKAESGTILSILVENGLDPRVRNDIILKTALKNWQTDLVQIVLEQIAKNSRNA